MSAAAQPHSDAMGSRFVPVGPSVIVRLVLGPLSKMLNPLVGAVAGRRFVPLIARVHHVGRRTGKLYMTPTDQSFNAINRFGFRLFGIRQYLFLSTIN